MFSKCTKVSYVKVFKDKKDILLVSLGHLWPDLRPVVV